MENGKYVVLVLLWLAFALTHSLLAAQNVKFFFQAKLRTYFKYYRLGYSLVATLLLILVLLYNFSITNDLLWQITPFEKIIAVLFCVSGLSVMLYCIKKYFFEMSGISVFFKTIPDDRLQVNGLNRFVRHPLYSGTLLFVLGCLLWYPGLANLISFLCIICYTLVGIKYEEKKLLRLFGEAYKNYASNVPMIIPGIRFRKKK